MESSRSLHIYVVMYMTEIPASRSWYQAWLQELSEGIRAFELSRRSVYRYDLTPVSTSQSLKEWTASRVGEKLTGSSCEFRGRC